MHRCTYERTIHFYKEKFPSRKPHSSTPKGLAALKLFGSYVRLILYLFKNKNKTYVHP
jgi:hypothetical protein